MADNPIVLLVDDNSDNLQLIANALKTLDCDLAYSDNPKDVLNQVQLISPDLILMDIIMPEINGYKLCCEIKSNKNFEDIPILFLTALNETMSIVRAFESGGVDYITKPYDIDELKARVGSHLKLKENNQKLRTELGDNSTTIDVLLKKYNTDLEKFKKNVFVNIETLIKPYIQSLQQSVSNKKQKEIIDIIIRNLDSITSSFYGPASQLKKLTPSEIRIANLIKVGKANKEISDLLCTSLSTIAFHRKNIREKLGLTNKKINLFCYLNSIENQ